MESRREKLAKVDEDRMGLFAELDNEANTTKLYKSKFLTSKNSVSTKERNQLEELI